MNLLISCAGLGMGNASRVSAVIQSLQKRNYERDNSLNLTVASWGAGYKFLKRFQKEEGFHFKLVELKPYVQKKPSRLQNLLIFPINYIKNTRFLRKLVCTEKFDIVLLDSDYHFFSYLNTGIKKYYIGQAYDVVCRFKNGECRPQSLREWLNLLSREWLDAIFQKVFADKILVPSFDVIDTSSSNLWRIPLIVRDEFRNIPKQRVLDNNQIEVGLLLSGSTIEKDIFKDVAKKSGLKTVSPSEKNEDSFEILHQQLLSSFDIVIVQGGLSSISECLAQNKFVAVFPISGHFEQTANAQKVTSDRRGLVGHPKDLIEFGAFIDKCKASMANAPTSQVNCSGSDYVVQAIFS